MNLSVRILLLALPLMGACSDHSAKDTPGDATEKETSMGDADPDAGASDDGERVVFKDMSDNEAAPLFERKEVIEVRLSLPSDEWDELLANARDEEYTEADVTIMGRRLEQVGLRIKGAVGSLSNCFDDDDNLICDKLGMKLKFNEYDEEQRFLGLKRINLQSWVNDPTKLHECIAYDIFREMDIVAPRCAWAYVFVNDEPLGLFGLVERVDGRFTDSRFEEGDGNLYKEAWPVTSEQDYFKERLKTNNDIAVTAAPAAFSEAMTAAKDSELPETLGRYMDSDYILRYMAVDFAIANWDGITTFYCGDNWCGNHNYYLYEEESRPFFWLIPWDLEASLFLGHWLGDIEPWDNLDVECDDSTKGNDSLFTRPAGCDPTIRAIALTDEDRYLELLAEVTATQLAPSVMLPRVSDMINLIAPYIEADPDVSYVDWVFSLIWQFGSFADIRTRAIETLAGTPYAVETTPEEDARFEEALDAIVGQIPMEGGLSETCQHWIDTLGFDCEVGVGNLLMSRKICANLDQVFEDGFMTNTVACFENRGCELFGDTESVSWTSCLFEAAPASTPQPEGIAFKERFCEYAILCDPEVDTPAACDQQFATDRIGLSLFLQTSYIEELDACLNAEPTCDDDAVAPCLEAATAAIVDQITVG